MTCAVLLISGLSDTLDGFIARHFNMISDLGKALDPIADKLTQFAMLMCLVSRFPMMLIPLLVLVVKELCCGLTSLMVIKKTGVVLPANWHGKLTTFLLYAMMCLHLVWINIPASVSYVYNRMYRRNADVLRAVHHAQRPRHAQRARRVIVMYIILC